MTKKTPKKAAKQPPRAAQPAPRTDSPTTPVASVTLATPQRAVPKPRPMARTRRALATPAQRRGADLVRFLKIHVKHPYGDRGINAIARLATEVGHLANVELAQRDTATK